MDRRMNKAEKLLYEIRTNPFEIGTQEEGGRHPLQDEFLIVFRQNDECEFFFDAAGKSVDYTRIGVTMWVGSPVKGRKPFMNLVFDKRGMKKLGFSSGSTSDMKVANELTQKKIEDYVKARKAGRSPRLSLVSYFPFLKDRDFHVRIQIK